MGFRPPMATHKLEWPEGHMLHGLHVKVRSVSVDEYNEITRLMLGQADSPDSTLDQNEKLLAKLAENLKDWDYEDPRTGEPLPPDRSGIGRADSTHMTMIIAAWVSALVSVPDPLPKPSPNGNSPSDSEESALQLGAASTSLPN